MHSSYKANSRYAKALFSLSEEQNISKEVYADMKLFIDTFMHHKELKALLENPALKFSHKKNILTDIFASRIHSLSLNFICLLIQNNKELFLQNIARQFVMLYREKHKIERFVIRAAIVPSPDFLEKLTISLREKTQGQVELKFKLSPHLIGGFTLQTDKLFLDLSIAGKLTLLKNELVTKAHQNKI